MPTRGTSVGDGGAGPRRLRSLLPAHQQALALDKGTGTASTLRQNVVAACDSCRKNKAKCSGDRPICRRCARLCKSCHYAAQQGETTSQALKRSYGQLRTRATAHEDLVSLLRDLPAADAQNILRRIRAGDDISDILSHIRVGDLRIQMVVEPESRFRYDLPYRHEMPRALRSNNPYLDSRLFLSAQLYPEQPASRTRSKEADLSSSEQLQEQYFAPFFAASVVDPLLTDVSVAPWTLVCEDDDFMRGLLSHLFRCEYQMTAALQKDLFLEDMAAQRPDFCSQLLVNVVLAYSCVCDPRIADRAEYWNPRTWPYRFLAEAKRLWELESGSAKLTTIQAGIIFNVFVRVAVR